MSKATGARHKFTREDVLTAIKGSGSIVSTVARRLGCEWITAKRYIEKWEETAQAFKDEEETILDMAESKLYEAIQNNDIQATKWLLATKGKKRGFSERHEITGADGSDININVVWGKSD